MISSGSRSLLIGVHLRLVYACLVLEGDWFRQLLGLDSGQEAFAFPLFFGTNLLLRVGGIMSSGVVDSAAYFKSYIERIGIPAASVKKLSDAGFNTVAALAYALPPGGEQQEHFDKFTVEYLGVDAPAGDKTLLRRAIHECYALSIAQLKSQVERTEDKPPPRLPPAERQARRARQKERLGAVDGGGFYEPSYKVLERVNEYGESDELKYEPWSFYNHRFEVRRQQTQSKLIQGFSNLPRVLRVELLMLMSMIHTLPELPFDSVVWRLIFTAWLHFRSWRVLMSTFSISSTCLVLLVLLHPLFRKLPRLIGKCGGW